MREAVVVLDMTRDSIAPEARGGAARQRDPRPELYKPDQDTMVHKRRYSGFFGSLQLIGWSTSLAAMAKSKIVRSDELMR